MGTSRGDCISGYYPNMGGTSGVKVYADNLKAQAVTGSILSANIVYAKTHNLGKVPTFIGITPWLAKDQAKTFTSGAVVALSLASAATSAVYYVIGNLKGIKYKAFLLI
jgi:hypothetical protein